MSVVDINDDEDDDWLQRAKAANALMRQIMLLQVMRDRTIPPHVRNMRIDHLVELGAKLNPPLSPAGGEHPLLAAIILGRTDIVKRAAAQGEDLRHIAGEGLIAAAEHGRDDMCRLFIGLGANVQVQDNRPLRVAVTCGNTGAVDILLRAGADIGAAEKAAKGTLLGIALEQRHPETAKMLLLHGVDAQQPHNKNLPRAIAAHNNFPSIVRLIDGLAAKGPALPRDFFERRNLRELESSVTLDSRLTGLQLAAENGHYDAVLEKLANLNRPLTKSDFIQATPEHPQTVLHILGRQGRLSDVFNRKIWANNARRMRETYNYIPAAFRHQVDVQALQTEITQDRLHNRKGSKDFRLNIPKK